MKANKEERKRCRLKQEEAKHPDKAKWELSGQRKEVPVAVIPVLAREQRVLCYRELYTLMVLG